MTATLYNVTIHKMQNWTKYWAGVYDFIRYTKKLRLIKLKKILYNPSSLKMCNDDEISIFIVSCNNNKKRIFIMQFKMTESGFF